MSTNKLLVLFILAGCTTHAAPYKNEYEDEDLRKMLREVK